jgi:hypothetical protein
MHDLQLINILLSSEDHRALLLGQYSFVTWFGCASSKLLSRVQLTLSAQQTARKEH